MFVESSQQTPLLTSATPSIKATSKLQWSLQSAVSRNLPQPHLPFVRYERSELAYQPHFEDILYFSCEAWIPDYLKEAPKILPAEQARDILTEYYVVPYPEWRNNYPKSGGFTYYTRLKFPDNNNLRLLVHEFGVAIVLYPDGGAVFLAKNLYEYQIDLAKKYKFRLRTDEI